jgi:pyruvate/2-oxoglutarate dehydrogenase complex dihydrolipoamide dehydrogenase (E3) component/uncharacterized membrane protein YdjX (TVP38/TMEM64 family)
VEVRGRIGRAALLLVVAAAIAAFFLLDLGRWLTLDQLKQSRHALVAAIEARPLLYVGGFFLLYMTAIAFSFPGALILTLAAGALFGFWTGLVLVSFASTIGASLAFLGSRYVLRDWVRRRFGPRLAAVDRGIERDGRFYLLSLRLNPAIPFFLVNLGMGLTRMKLPSFYLVSQAGMLPGTLVYVNAGTQLASIESSGDILSPGLLLALLLLSLFPFAAKWGLALLRKRRVYRGWKRPRRFDRNLIVIGGGAGGLVTAYIAAAVQAKVTLIEAKEMGGDCLNTGCVPSKALIATARAAQAVRAAGAFGIEAQPPRIRFAEVIERVHRTIAEIAPNDSPERYRELGVDVRQGYAKLVDPWTVEIDGGERLTARSIVIAAGGEPTVPDIPGLAGSGYLTSDTLWGALRGRGEPPGRLVIVGGGPIGAEMAQAFARLGTRVTLVEEGPRLLPRDDEEAAGLIEAVVREEGVEVRTGARAVRVEGRRLHILSPAGEDSLAYDELLIAVGRKARLTGYGLETLGIETERVVVTNDWLETLYPNIYAVGDVAGPYQFTHFAAHQAWHAAVNALFGSVKRFRADYRVVPRVTFTDPEVAQVGHNELSAREGGVEYELVRYDLSHLDRAITEGERRGFVKLLVQPGKDRILGATVVGASAGETIAEIVLAMKHGLGLNKLLGTIHAYPTMAEANKYAAGEWKKAHKPERALAWAERWHSWRRR